MSHKIFSAGLTRTDTDPILILFSCVHIVRPAYDTRATALCGVVK